MGYSRKNEDSFYVRCGVSTEIYYVKKARSTTVLSMTALGRMGHYIYIYIYIYTHTHTHAHIHMFVFGASRWR